MKFIEFCKKYLGDVKEAPDVLDASDILKDACGPFMFDPYDRFTNKLYNTRLGEQIDIAYRRGVGEKALRFAFDNADMEMDDLSDEVSRYVASIAKSNCAGGTPIVLDLFRKYNDLDF